MRRFFSIAVALVLAVGLLLAAGPVRADPGFALVIVPEPGSLLLLASGLAGLALTGCRRGRRE